MILSSKDPKERNFYNFDLFGLYFGCVVHWKHLHQKGRGYLDPFIESQMKKIDASNASDAVERLAQIYLELSQQKLEEQIGKSNGSSKFFESLCEII